MVKRNLWCISPWVINNDANGKTYRYPLVSDALDPGTPPGIDRDTGEIYPAKVTFQCYPSDPRDAKANHSHVVCLVSARDFTAVLNTPGVRVIGKQHTDVGAYILSTPRKDGWTSNDLRVEETTVDLDTTIREIVNQHIAKNAPRRILK